MSDLTHTHQLPNGENHGNIYMDGLESNNVNELNGFTEGNGEPKGPPQACLFVASLAPETTEEALRDFFVQSGVEPLKVKVLKDRSERARPYAFVQFKSADEANMAIQNTNNRILDGRRIRVEKAKVNRTLFIAKMDKTLNSTQLREIVESFGPIENVTIIKNHQTNKSKGCGFVKFIYREDAMNAYMNLKANQKKWVIEWATSNNDPESLGIDRNNIFVGGLNPILITRELIEQRFGQYGRIDTISLVNKDNLDEYDDDDELPEEVATSSVVASSSSSSNASGSNNASPTTTANNSANNNGSTTATTSTTSAGTANNTNSSGTSSASPSPSIDNNASTSGRSAFAFLRYAEPSGSALAIEHENGAEWLDRRIRVQYCESQEMKNKRRATKYFTSVAQYNTAQYYRPHPHSIPNGAHALAPHPMMVVSGGIPMYNMQALHHHHAAAAAAHHATPMHPHSAAAGPHHTPTHPHSTHHHAANAAAAAANRVGMAYPHLPHTHSHVRGAKGATNGVVVGAAENSAASATPTYHPHASPYLPPYPHLMNMNLNHPAAAGMNMMAYTPQSWLYAQQGAHSHLAAYSAAAAAVSGSGGYSMNGMPAASGSESPTGISPNGTPGPSNGTGGLNIAVGSVSGGNSKGLHSLRHQQQLADQFVAEDLLDHESVLANSLAAISLERPRW